MAAARQKIWWRRSPRGRFHSVLKYQLAALLLVAGLCVESIGATISETFDSDPRSKGWGSSGDTNLFRWSSLNQKLEVTWDSSRTNSFFHFPLGTVVTKADDFALAFDLRVRDISIGTSSNRPDTFEIAIGLMNSTNLGHANYFRGAGVSATYGVRNSVEFDYFPPTGVIEPTFAPTVISSNNAIKFSDNRLQLTTNDLFRIAMIYTASNQVLKTVVTRNGLPFGNPPSNTLKDLVLTNHADFRVDRIAVMNYSDAIQVGPPQFWGSVLAHGTIDDIVVTVPEPPVTQFAGQRTNGTWRATFVSRTNWFYALERSSNLNVWNVVSPTNSGTGSFMTLVDSNAPAGDSFYRVKARRQ